MPLGMFGKISGPPGLSRRRGPSGPVWAAATGGTTTDINIGGIDYRVHQFTVDNDGTDVFTVTTPGIADILLVGGGGAGGYGTENGGGFMGGGGGGGQVKFLEQIELSASSYSLTVGSGASSSYTNGNNTVGFSNTALGGGYGGGYNGSSINSASRTGPSGGAGSGFTTAGSGTQRGGGGKKQTYNSPYSIICVGGGGASSVNAGGTGTISAYNNYTAGAGANGPDYSAYFGTGFGDNGYFGGGGSGAASNIAASGTSSFGNDSGRLGGGGLKGSAGTAHTGGGGGGNGVGSGGPGGSGIILVRYQI